MMECVFSITNILQLLRKNMLTCVTADTNKAPLGASMSVLKKLGRASRISNQNFTLLYIYTIQFFSKEIILSILFRSQCRCPAQCILLYHIAVHHAWVVQCGPWGHHAREFLRFVIFDSFVHINTYLYILSTRETQLRDLVKPAVLTDVKFGLPGGCRN